MTAGLDQRALTAAALPGPGGPRPDTQADALRRRFPPRPAATAWPQTRLSRQEVAGRLLAAPFAADGAAGEDNRRRGLRLVVDWLETQPGGTWQQRWLASGADGDGRADWRASALRWRQATTPWDRATITRACCR
jgi:hypothetical protein